MKREQRYQEMRSGYEQLVERIMPAAAEKKDGKTPQELEWAHQEGFAPKYNPNSDKITWVPQPQPTYNQPNIMRLRGSMSPERLAEMYPAFASKAKELDPLITQLYQAAIDGKITQQRAQEIALQAAENSYGDMWKGNIKGASKSAANFDQTLESMSSKNKIAGE